ncbi:ribose-phosphate pyrophosphokinase [Candidatus Woesebacteria bacterium]|nr:ribose-phosphate pyrophosphokinase [Candidatus Woesebacteria bacterium]
MILLSGSSNISLAQKIAEHLGQPLGSIESSTFANGERRVWVKEEVKGKDVALIQSFSEPVDAHIIEFSLIVDALFRLGARRVFAVIPWFGYSLQDKSFRPGEPIAAKVIATMLGSLSIYRYILLNLHNNSSAGFFQNPTSVLSSDSVFEQEIKALGKDTVLVSSDFGGLKKVGLFSQRLNLPFANIDKRRDLVTGQVLAHSISGDVENKTAVILDDIINSGSTAIEAARIAREHGAKKILMLATHALLAGDASQRLQESEIDEVIVTDTVDSSAKRFPKLRVLSISHLIADELAQWSK